MERKHFTDLEGGLTHFVPLPHMWNTYKNLNIVCNIQYSYIIRIIVCDNYDNNYIQAVDCDFQPVLMCLCQCC